MLSDPYKYFRIESRELLEGLIQGALTLERGAGDESLVGKLLRLAHTLKGASRVVKQGQIADLAHGVESILAPFRDTPAPVPRERALEILKLLDQVGGLLPALDAPAGPVKTVLRQESEDLPDTVRVEVGEVETLLETLSEAGVYVTGFAGQVEVVQRARRTAALIEQGLKAFVPAGSGSGSRLQSLAQDLLGTLQRLDHSVAEQINHLEREVSQSRELASRLRLMPASSIFPSLIRAARDAALVLGKSAELVPSGGEIRLEGQVLTTVREALLHLVRNAVAHGIETADQRRACGKSAAGRIELRIERRGARVAFICRDDGRGIDLPAIRRAAVKAGSISPAAAESLELQQAIDMILRGGVSTASEVTGISGRGIGLDIVRQAVARLKGDISVETTSGAGTTVDLCVPVSLTSIAALTLESGAVRACIPMDCVRETIRVARSEILTGPTGESIVYNGLAIPLLPLSAALGETAASPLRNGSAVVINSHHALIAVAVDRVDGIRTVLVHTLPATAAASGVLAGVTLDEQGNPRPVLDPNGLLAAAETGLRREPAAVPRPPILVIDDSLTTRMVEQSVLESAGHQVEIAASAEEALDKAREKRYGLFLVDVEMPGMDGFEFVSLVSRDSALSQIPAILVTSRSSLEDRNRGKAAGAAAYIVKSEFDHARFLQTVEQLARR